MLSSTPHNPHTHAPNRLHPAADLVHPSYVKAHIVALPPLGTLFQRLLNLSIRYNGVLLVDPDTGDASFPCTLPNALINTAIHNQSGRLIGGIAQGEIRLEEPVDFLPYPTILPDDLLAALHGRDR